MFNIYLSLDIFELKVGEEHILNIFHFMLISFEMIILLS